MSYLGKEPLLEATPVPGSVTSDSIATDAVTADKLANNSVGTNELVNSSVTADKIATDAVTGEKLANNAVVENLGYTPLNKAGDTTQGPLTLGGELHGGGKTYDNLNAKVTNLGNVTGTVNIDIRVSPAFRLTPIANTTVNFTNLPAADIAAYWEVEVETPGSFTTTFTGVTWDGGVQPTIPGGTRNSVFAFRVRNGSKIYGSLSFRDIA